MAPEPLGAVVLAAGRSRRMGRPKALLRLDGVTLLERVVLAAIAGGVERVAVVVGGEGDGLLSDHVAGALLASERRVHVVVGAPDGMPIDSIRSGLGALPAGPLLLWPVDHPFGDANLVRALAAALPSPGHIVVPIAGGGHGHPILLGASVRDELLAAGLPQGARSVVHRDPRRVVELPWADARIVADVDTPEEARRLGIEI